MLLFNTKYKLAADFDFLVRLFIINRVKYKIVSRCWVRMRTGGASNSGWSSKSTITKEMRASLQDNNVYSNYAMIISRLAIKFITQIMIVRAKNFIKKIE